MGMEDDEFKNFIKVWVLATTCLCYGYYIASRIPKGVLRLLSLLPIFYLFIIFPLKLSSIHLGGPTSFFLVWLGNFKLLLFSFDQGPLSSPSPLTLFHFISLACLPIKLKNNSNPSHQTLQKPSPNPQSSTRSLLFPIKVALLPIIFYSYNYRHAMHPYVILALYCLHIYLELELILAISATPALALFGFELEPQFNEPYLATSLQDFWGHRWNLMVTSILRPTVYEPARHFFMGFFGPTWASCPAVIAAFVVSGLMHEIMYFYLTQVSPTWEVTCFFVLHGFCVALEVALKKVVKNRWQLHRAISGPLTVFFAAVTAVWLFFPQLIRNRVDHKVIKEYSIFVSFVMQKVNALFSF